MFIQLIVVLDFPCPCTCGNLFLICNLLLIILGLLLSPENPLLIPKIETINFPFPPSLMKNRAT